MVTWWILCFACVILHDVFLTKAANPSPEQTLIRELLTGYNPNGRPVLLYNKTIKVKFGLEIVQIIDVDTRYQTIKTNVWIRQVGMNLLTFALEKYLYILHFLFKRWKNDILNWNSTGYQGLEKITLEPYSIWTPDIVLYNSGDSKSKSGVEKFKTRVIVNHDGSVAWFSPALYITTCTMDITYFPFDQQTCKMKFGSWTFMETQVDIFPANDPIFSDKYIPSTEWHVVSAWKQRKTANYTCCEKPLSFLEFEMMIRRRPLFYAFNLITPCLIFLSVILLGFCLPPESRERITLNITVLLAMAVFMQLMAKSLPRNADTTPLLGRFYITIMTEIALSLIATCFILNIYHGHFGAVPTWVEVVVLHWLGAVLCVRRPHSDLLLGKKDFELEKMNFTLNANHKQTESGSDITIPIMNGHAPGSSTAGQKYMTKITYNDGLPLTTFLKNRSASLSRSHDSSTSVMGLLSTIRESKRRRERRRLKWKHVAMVVDRLIFFIVVLTTVISISAVFRERIRQSFGEE